MEEEAGEQRDWSSSSEGEENSSDASSSPAKAKGLRSDGAGKKDGRQAHDKDAERPGTFGLRTAARSPAQLLDPLEVRFSQMKMRHLFGDGRRVSDAVQEIKAVRASEQEQKEHGAQWRLQAPFPDVEVIRWCCKLRDEKSGKAKVDEVTGEELYDDEEHWFTLDNRRLYCLQEAALKVYPERAIVTVAVVLSGPHKNMRELRKFRTLDKGRSVVIGSRDSAVQFVRWSWREKAGLEKPPPGIEGELLLLKEQNDRISKKAAKWDVLDHLSSLTPDSPERIEISKRISWVLRGGAPSSGVPMDGEGWVTLPDLAKAPCLKGMTVDQLLLVVGESNQQKWRYELRSSGSDGTFIIRAAGRKGVSRTAASLATSAAAATLPVGAPPVARTWQPAQQQTVEREARARPSQPTAAAVDSPASSPTAAWQPPKVSLPVGRKAVGSQIRGPVAPGAVSPSSNSAIPAPPGINLAQHRMASSSSTPSTGRAGGAASSASTPGTGTSKAKAKAAANKTIRAPPLVPTGVSPAALAAAGSPVAALGAFAAMGAFGGAGSPWTNPAALGANGASPVAAAGAAQWLATMRQMMVMQQMMTISSQYQVHFRQQLQELMRLRVLQQMQVMSQMQQVQAVQELETMWESMQGQSPDGESGGFWDAWGMSRESLFQEAAEEQQLDPSSMSADDLEGRISEVLQAAQDRLSMEKAAAAEAEAYEAYMHPGYTRPSRILPENSTPEELEVRIQQTMQAAALRRSDEAAAAAAWEPPMRSAPAKPKAPQPLQQSSVEAQVAAAWAGAKSRTAAAAGPGPNRPSKGSAVQQPASAADLQAKIDEAMRAARERSKRGGD